MQISEWMAILSIFSILPIGFLVWLWFRLSKPSPSRMLKTTTGLVKGVTVRLGSGSIPLAQLVTVEGPNVGREYAISESVIRIGRDPEYNDIALFDEFVSNPHLSLRFSEGQFFIADEGSTNGTRLNGLPISPHRLFPLRDGDTIEVGQTQYQFKSTFQWWDEQIARRLHQEGTVRLDDLEGLASQYRATILSDYVAKEPESDLVCSSNGRMLSLRRVGEFRKVRDAWQILRSRPDRAEVIRSIKQMIEALELSLGLHRDTIDVNPYKALYCTSINTGLIFQGLNIPSHFPTIFLLETEVNIHQLDDMRYALATVWGAPRQLFLLFVTSQNSNQAESLLSNKLIDLLAYDVIWLTFDDTYKIIASREPQRIFKQLVLSQVSLVTVSPYNTTGPVADNVFFGREFELRNVAEHSGSKSYAVIGGRRIGKTSLLGRLHCVRLPANGFRTLYHDCATTPTYDAFLTSAIRDWRPESPSGILATFEDLLQSPPADKPLVLLLDEADKLVPVDRANGWPLFSALRALANSGYAQVVFSGERTLRDALRDPAGPLFNFANEMLLGPLDFHAVEELVTQPMRQLEIELVDEKAIVDRIWVFTSGHPNVVQRLCRRLIERLNEQGTRRIMLDDVNAVIEDPGLQREDFLSTYWEAATSLEKIISLLMADDESVRTLRTVRQALAERCNLHPKAREVDDALQRLVDLRSILKRTPTGYEFAVTAFPRVVAGTMTLEDMLEVWVEDYAGEQAKGEA